MSWQEELRQRVRSREQLERLISLTPEERAWFARAGSRPESFGLNISPHFLSLVSGDPGDPIRRQCVPRVEELSFLPRESGDPLEEEKHRVLPRLIHRYRDRALILVTDRCAVACRHCFRRNFAGSGEGTVSPEELRAIGEYLAAHGEIGEVILSGGDPLSLEDGRLFAVMDAVRAAREGIVLRLGTRTPAALPSRITPRLVRGLARRRPLWGVLHLNHPRELGPECTAALARLVDGGIPLLSQTVLLRGVNDDPETLEELFRGLVSRGVKPYYLFQGDLARGTAHFRVPLSRGWEIMRILRRRLSAMALPVYAVDLPGGGGKIPLTESFLRGEEGDSWLFQSVEGGVFRYPKEEEK